MTKEEAQLKAFQIIAAAGNAFGLYYNAVKRYRDNDLESAKKLIKEGDEELTKAHLIQTELIQAEIRGEEVPPSLVLTHSQDHLLQAMMWEKVASLLVGED